MTTTQPFIPRGRIGLTLGNDAARGMAHIGVLEAMERCGS